jgi:hypothetical protein
LSQRAPSRLRQVVPKEADRRATGLQMAASSFSEKAYLGTALIIIRFTRLVIIRLFGLFRARCLGLGTGTVGAGRVDAGGKEFQ